MEMYIDESCVLRGKGLHMARRNYSIVTQILQAAKTSPMPLYPGAKLTQS